MNSLPEWFSWVASGVVGGAAFLLVKEVFIPIIADMVFFHAPIVRGRWKAEITTDLGGEKRKTSEVVIVRQLGSRIWGWTEIGAHPVPTGLGVGNKFSGFLRGYAAVVTFESRDRSIPWVGCMLIHLEDPTTATGYSVGMYEGKEPIMSEHALKKAS